MPINPPSSHGIITGQDMGMPSTPQPLSAFSFTIPRVAHAGQSDQPLVEPWPTSMQLLTCAQNVVTSPAAGVRIIFVNIFDELGLLQLQLVSPLTVGPAEIANVFYPIGGERTVLFGSTFAFSLPDQFFIRQGWRLDFVGFANVADTQVPNFTVRR